MAIVNLLHHVFYIMCYFEHIVKFPQAHSDDFFQGRRATVEGLENLKKKTYVLLISSVKTHTNQNVFFCGGGISRAKLNIADFCSESVCFRVSLFASVSVRFS